MESRDAQILRDRTQEFLILRSAAKRQSQWMASEPSPVAGTPTGVAGGDGSDLKKEAAPLPQPSWVGCLERCRDLEESIRTRLERLQKGQQDCFATKFSVDEEEEHDQRKSVEKQAGEVAKLLKELERMVKIGAKVPADSETDDQRAALSVQKHLVTNLNVLLTSYKDGQTLYAEQIKRRDAKTKKFQNLGTAEVQERIEHQEKVAGYMEMGYSTVEIQELMTLDAQATEQNNEVQQILQSVTELHEMFQELHDLVIEQGTVLDRIDYNLTNTVAKLDKGHKNLQKAREHQKKCVLS